ncbi:MAG: hypothetical protein IPN17_05635 [Deltaproteobacteria bacterium]|nr:hypothetical protein [Deltaproteobacteria bacterium]
MKMLSLALGLLAIGCGGGGSGATCPTSSTLTYDNFGRQFFATYCDRCHAAGTRPALNTLALIQANSTAIDSWPRRPPSPRCPRVAHPPRPTRQLGEWLACGAR